MAYSSVNVYVLRLDLDRQKRNPLLLQCVTLPNDKLLVIGGGQAGIQPGQASLRLAESDAPVCKDQPPFSSLLRLWLNRRLSACLGMELVDFAS